MYSNKKIASVLLNASVNGSACRVAKIVSGLLLAVVLCANISLKGGDSRGEKRASEDSEGLMAIADASLGSEAVLRVSVVSALLSFRNAGANDIGGRPREAVGAVVVEGGVSEGVGSGKRKRNDTGRATGQPAAKRARDGEKPYVCGIGECEFKAAYLGSMKKHQATHAGEKPYVCDFEGCGYKTRELSILSQHKQKHSNDRRFKCTVCDYEAKRKSHLDSHVKTKHTGKNNLSSCDFEGCDYASNQMYSLKTHMIRHTSEKPFVCDFEGCGYRAVELGRVERHRRTHTGEKPFVCGHEGCGYRAAELVSLKIHKRIHTGEKPYVCDLEGCDYASNQMDHLKTHMRRHTSEKPYVCDFEGCNYESTELGVLEQHEKRHSCNVSGCVYTAAKVVYVERHRKLHGVGAGLSVGGHVVS